MREELVVHVDCPECDQRVVVMPPALWSVLPEHAQIEAARQMGELSSDRGERFAIADMHGSFTCPNCGHQWRVPEGLGTE